MSAPPDEPRLKVVGDSGTHHQPRPLGTAEDWRLEVGGEVAAPRSFSLEDLESLGGGPVSAEIPIHCVSAGGICGKERTAVFEGIRLLALADAVKPGPAVRTVEFISRAPGTCGPRSRRHRTALKLADVLDPANGVMLAWKLGGEPLPYPNGGPLRSIVGPELFFYKGIKWLEEIRFRPEPLEQCRGTWEEYAGYHNRARVALDERFEPCLRRIVEVVTGPGGEPEDRTEEIAEGDWQAVFDDACRRKDFSRLVAAQLHRGVTEMPTDLADAVFVDGSFRAKIRGTSFAGADLTGARMAGGNFSLSKFTNVKFSDAGERPADLSGCDFEGAYFNRAELRGVSMRGACLTNTTFCGPGDFDHPSERVEGLDLRGAVNLDERTAAWLRRGGALLDS